MHDHASPWSPVDLTGPTASRGALRGSDEAPSGDDGSGSQGASVPDQAGPSLGASSDESPSGPSSPLTTPPPSASGSDPAARTTDFSGSDGHTSSKSMGPGSSATLSHQDAMTKALDCSDKLKTAARPKAAAAPFHVASKDLHLWPEKP